MLHLLKTTVKIKKKYKFVPGKPFNPNFDGNLLAWYDGDTLATDPANTWSDRSGNGYNLTLFNAPTIVSPAINGHDALQFDGINQYAQCAILTVNQPDTIYLVAKKQLWQDGSYYFDGLVNRQILYQVTANPNVAILATTNNLNANPDPVINNYEIMTCVFNNPNSEIRTNNNAAVIGITGNNALTNLLISESITGICWESTFAYMIFRQGADNTATQNIFINYLKNRFAL